MDYSLLRPPPQQCSMGCLLLFNGLNNTALSRYNVPDALARSCAVDHLLSGSHSLIHPITASPQLCSPGSLFGPLLLCGDWHSHPLTLRAEMGSPPFLLPILSSVPRNPSASSATSQLLVFGPVRSGAAELLLGLESWELAEAPGEASSCPVRVTSCFSSRRTS